MLNVRDTGVCKESGRKRPVRKKSTDKSFVVCHGGTEYRTQAQMARRDRTFAFE
jgi:hypothetical protein